MATEPAGLIVPDWPAPARVCAWVSTRSGGASAAPYDSLNLAAHVGDEPAAVAENRRRLSQACGLDEPQWLQQVHGTRVVRLPQAEPVPQADAAFSVEPGVACAVLVADCMPVLFCDEGATVVAAAHAGWRGLAGGVLEACVSTLPVAPQALMAWMGPAIGPADFEVGEDVRQAFVSVDPAARAAFRPRAHGKYLADLYELARQRLARAGVSRIHGGGLSTLAEPDRFFSFRRDGSTGRMAALIALQA